MTKDWNFPATRKIYDKRFSDNQRDIHASAMKRVEPAHLFNRVPTEDRLQPPDDSAEFPIFG